MSDEPEVEVRPEDALQVAQRALAKANENERRLEEAVEELTTLKLRYSEVEEDRDYDATDTDGNVGRVREYAFKKATSGHGRATLTYDDIMWGVFDGEPSPAYCYKLMRLAAGVDPDGNEVQRVRGFKILDSSQPMKLAVDAGEAKRSASFYSANKTEPSEVRSR